MKTLVRMWGLAAAFSLWAGPAAAVDCGEADCGPHGECDPAGLAARCSCEAGYVSVSTYIPDRNFGAYCVPIGALPSEKLCEDNSCGPHGVCVVQGGDAGPAARCECDLGYRATSDLACEDDPAEDAEAGCKGAVCGEDSTCMAVPDGLTCRCAAGGVVVLGAREGEDLPDQFGPACSFPLDPDEACGPDACGPRGDCILGQAVICDCEPGYEELDRTARDGKKHGYCLPEGSPENPEAPPPDEYTTQEGGDSGAANPNVKDAGLGPSPVDAGKPSKPKEPESAARTNSDSCSIHLAGGAGGRSAPWGVLSLLGFTAFWSLARRTR